MSSGPIIHEVESTSLSSAPRCLPTFVPSTRTFIRSRNAAWDASIRHQMQIAISNGVAARTRPRISPRFRWGEVEAVVTGTGLADVDQQPESVAATGELVEIVLYSLEAFRGDASNVHN